MENSEVERLRRETADLERLLSDLKLELMSRVQHAPQQHNYDNTNGRNEYEDWEDEKVAYEIKLQREQMKVDNFEESIQSNNAKFANEINMLK
jgi:alpha-D-ribose 1-methylphosphonate 5-triphosphate diphosphatase PhnM